MIKIVKVIIFILLLVMCDCVSNVMFNFLQDNALKQSPTGMIAEYTVKMVDSEIVIIGSSRAANHYVSSILADSLSYSVYNCGSGGNLFYYQTCMIDAILRRYAPKMIIWELDPLFLSSINDNLELDRLSRLLPLHNSNTYIDSILYKRSKFEKIKVKSAMYRYNSRLTNLLACCSMPDHFDRGYSPLNTEGYKFPSIEKEILSDSYSGEREELFIRIIEKCLFENVEIVFCFSPKLTESNYHENLSYKRIVEIASNKNLRLIDFYHDEKFMNDSTLFYNSNHLNDRGAKKYTMEIVAKLR